MSQVYYTLPLPPFLGRRPPAPISLQPMDTAPTNCPIVAYCKHSADPGPDAESLSHVEDGWHVLVWGGAWDDRSLEDPGAGWLPDWWFVNDGTFEVAANPIGWLVALPNEEPAAP